RERFAELMADRPMIHLKSQMRVKAGEGYIDFVNDLLEGSNVRSFQGLSDYELVFFDTLDDLYDRLKARERKFQLCRLVAGYAWKWTSKNDPNQFDIEIDGLQLKWNKEHIGWINSGTAAEEVGCIHTVQGYDLNYVGVIFGPEIVFNRESSTIEILRHRYEDRNGKAGVENDHDLKRYVLNIYQTLMCRGIHGTFVYACDPGLREYLKRSFQSIGAECVGAGDPEIAEPFKILDPEELRFSQGAVPKLDIQAAAGGFSADQWVEDCEWVEVIDEIRTGPDHFIVQVYGESMNRIIPNGAWCLFRKNQGGSRNGKVVLVQHRNIQDPDNGGNFTVKYYNSEKVVDQDSYQHVSIVLSPYSTDSAYSEIQLKDDQLHELKVIGGFVQVLGR
ncbi:MAG: DUF2075 domain-containing protein, partial [Opitutales bacterium]|nr:DUF2075 domain-containing protein [Opitutales bacterium]